ncbi:MAG: TIGR02301 family protein [Hyphomicrobium sp.]
MGTLGLSANAAMAAPDVKPYDDRLLRLSEILGAIHYLRELCSANEGQYWRDRMRELMDAEGSSALRRAKLTRAFNQGYRSYSRTYNTCSPSAQTAITRFLSEGSSLSEGLLKAFP